MSQVDIAKVDYHHFNSSTVNFGLRIPVSLSVVTPLVTSSTILDEFSLLFATAIGTPQLDAKRQEIEDTFVKGRLCHISRARLSGALRVLAIKTAEGLLSKFLYDLEETLRLVGVDGATGAVGKSDPSQGALTSIGQTKAIGAGPGNESQPDPTYPGADILIDLAAGLVAAVKSTNLAAGEQAAQQKHAEECALLKKAAGDAAKNAAVEQAKQQKAAGEAAAQKKKDEEVAAQKKVEEAAAQKAVGEAAAKKKAAEQAAEKAAVEQAAQQKAVDEAAAQKKTEEEAAAKKKVEEAAARKATGEALAKKMAGEEAAAKEKAAKAAAEKQAAEEAAAKKAAEEAAARQKAEQAAAEKKAAEEAAKKKAEEEAEAKKKAEEAAAQKKEAEEKAARMKVEEEAKKKQVEEAKETAKDAMKIPVGTTAENTKVVAALNLVGKCANGYSWKRVEGGFLCAGRGHYVADAQLTAP
ncbi:uncharacterized protein KY384_002194 [Bacidia gigantensis]|uniref:uncharacterized protein n=1 Tax=Bacidia gigantensis TaxID=2732470 RepID=UPI001D04FC57|nr:uncharacterized protein KY384_002194 [Bacidia gigantensis]KAG8533411.1 hypothetical protein KY384_002194 [Bacidia gigantensis]